MSVAEWLFIVTAVCVVILVFLLIAILDDYLGSHNQQNNYTPTVPSRFRSTPKPPERFQAPAYDPQNPNPIVSIRVCLVRETRGRKYRERGSYYDVRSALELFDSVMSFCVKERKTRKHKISRTQARRIIAGSRWADVK